MAKTRISCPKCRQPITAEVDQLIDVGADPSLKQKFLGGATNFMQCTACGYQGQISTLLVYHDPEKELLLTFVPPEAGLPRNEQERLIGNLINQAVNRLPVEKRKAYLLRPQQTLTYQGLVERVLEADGITKEMIEGQQKRLLLIQRLAEASPESIPEIAKQEDALMDGEFFLLIRRLVESAVMGNERETAERLANIQKVLVPLTTYGREAQAKAQEWDGAVKELRAAGDQLTREKLLELVIGAGSETRLQAYVSMARPMMDYLFFQGLSEKIERARGDGRGRLTTLRERLLSMTREIDLELEARQAQAQKLIASLVAAPNVREATEKVLGLVDEFFTNALGQALEEARKAGDLEKMAKLKDVVSVIEEASAPPPEVALIEEMLSSENEAALQAVFEKHQAEITPEFLEILAQFAAQYQAQGGDQEMAKRLIALHSIAQRFIQSKSLRV